MQPNYDPRYPSFSPYATVYNPSGSHDFAEGSGFGFAGDGYEHASRPTYAAMSPMLPPAPSLAPASPGFSPTGHNPLQGPLAAGILGNAEAARLTYNAADLAMDLAGTLFATSLAGKVNGVNLAGGGFAIGGSFVPSAECRLELMGPCDASGEMWFVRSHQRMGAAANVAAGGGMAVIGGGAMVGAAWEDAWTYVAAVPVDVARALVPSTEASTLVRILQNVAGKHLVCWPDFSQLDNLKIGEATRTTHMKRGTLGIVVSTMLQNGLGYMSLSGTSERVLWRRDPRFLEISDAFAHVRECGLAAGLSVLEKIDLRHESTHATRITLRFDLQHPAARALAERIAQDPAQFPFSLSPKHQGTWIERFFHDLPAGVEAVKLEAVNQTRNHVGGGMLDSLAKYVKASGLGLSFDVMHDQRQEIDAAGVLTSDTTAHLKQVGVLWLGTSSQLVFVNAQYGQLHGQQEPVFLGLVLGMQYEVTKVRGTNRNGFLEDFNDAFGTDIPEFKRIASHSGYYVSIRRLLTAADLARLSTLDASSLANIGVADPKRVGKLMRLRDLLQSASAQSKTGPRPEQAAGGFAPFLLADATLAGASASDDEALTMARARVMQDEISGIKTLGALCRWLGGGSEAMQVCVRHGACEKPLEGMRKFALEYSGLYAQVRASDAIDEVRRRFKQADKLRSQLDRALEALHQDVLGNALAADSNDAVGQQLLEAYIALDNATNLEHLTPRQRAALIRQEDIFRLLPATEQAHALCLHDRNGFWETDASERTRVLQALADAAQRINNLTVPHKLQALRGAQLDLVNEALTALTQSTPDFSARTWGLPVRLTLPDDRLRTAQAAAAQGDPLCKLAAYDLHFLVQDNEKTAGHAHDIREAIAAFSSVARRYDPQGVVDVTFLNAALAHMPAQRIWADADIHNLAWQATGTNAMVGNALEGSLQDFVSQARQRPQNKYAAYIVITTGVMQDPKVVVDALKRVQEAVVDFEDEVCVGFLQLKHDRRDGTHIVAGLDAHAQVGHLIEADTQVDLPIAERVYPLLSGMLNPAQDDANNKRNKANAVKDRLHRLAHWQWRGDA